jgi:hypothetical protein
VKRKQDRRFTAVAASLEGGALRMLGLLLALLALAIVVVPSARAATYKWVDEKGVVHYTDKIPPEAINKGNVQLDKHGVPVKRTDPAPTPEQRKAKADEESRQQQLTREREMVDRRDRALLATYTTESEIELARKRALFTIEQQVQSSTAYTVQLNKRKAELEQRKAAPDNKAKSLVQERELANIDTELAKQADLVAAKQKEIILVNARYDTDTKRWRELRAATEAQMNASAAAAAAANGNTGGNAAVKPTPVRKQ